jgi:hypothetical protein
MDFCLDLSDLPNAADLAPVVETLLREGHKVQQAIAILCGKTAEHQGLIPKLTELSALVDQPTDVKIDNFLGEGFTLGKLARNALEGLAMMAEARIQNNEGKLTKEQFENRKFLIAVEFEATGEAYRKQVDEAFTAWLESQKAAPAAAPAPAPAAPAAAAPAPAAPAAPPAAPR